MGAAWRRWQLSSTASVARPFTSVQLEDGARKHQDDKVRPDFLKYLLEANISEVKIPYKLHSHK